MDRLLTDEERRKLARVAGLRHPFARIVFMVIVPLAIVGWAGAILSQDRDTPGVALVLVAATVPLFLVAAALSLRRSLRTKRELADHPRLVTEDGQIRYARGTYVATVGRRRLRPIDVPFQPIPGRYRLTFLPHSGWLVAAALIAADADGGLGDLLAVVHRFDDHELRTNRAGRLGHVGRQRLIRGVLVNAGEVTLAAGAAIYWALWVARLPWLGLWSLALWVPVVVAGYAAKLFGNDCANGLRDLVAGRVLGIEDEIQRKNWQSSRGVQYSYLVGPLKFNVSYRAYSVPLPTRLYRVYYTPRLKRLISVEPSGPVHPSADAQMMIGR